MLEGTLLISYRIIKGGGRGRRWYSKTSLQTCFPSSQTQTGPGKVPDTGPLVSQNEKPKMTFELAAEAGKAHMSRRGSGNTFDPDHASPCC